MFKSWGKINTPTEEECKKQGKILIKETVRPAHPRKEYNKCKTGTKKAGVCETEHIEATNVQSGIVPAHCAKDIGSPGTRPEEERWLSVEPGKLSSYFLEFSVIKKENPKAKLTEHFNEETCIKAGITARKVGGVSYSEFDHMFGGMRNIRLIPERMDQAKEFERCRIAALVALQPERVESPDNADGEPPQSNKFPELNPSLKDVVKKVHKLEPVVEDEIKKYLGK